MISVAIQLIFQPLYSIERAVELTWQFLLLQAEHELVVLEVESTDMCQSGLGPEAELHWEEDKKASLSRCANLKHVFARTARDCPDVTFLTLEVRLCTTLCLVQLAVMTADLCAGARGLQAMHTKNTISSLYALSIVDIALRIAGTRRRQLRRSACEGVCRRTQRRARQHVMRLGWKCCRRSNSGGMARSCGSTEALCSWSRTWEKVIASHHV